MFVVVEYLIGAKYVINCNISHDLNLMYGIHDLLNKGHI